MVIPSCQSQSQTLTDSTFHKPGPLEVMQAYTIHSRGRQAQRSRLALAKPSPWLVIQAIPRNAHASGVIPDKIPPKNALLRKHIALFPPYAADAKTFLKSMLLGPVRRG